MIKNKDFSSQIHAYHALINNLQNKYFVSPKLFVSRYLIETLIKSQKNYKNNIKHGREQCL